MITTTQSRLYERQVKGVEDLWNAVIALAPAKSVSASMAMLNLDEIVKKAPYEPKYMQFFKDLPQFDQKTLQTIRPEASRPFVSPLAWAMYSAYQSILIYGTLRLKTLQLGLYDDFADIGHIKKIVKAALPHRSDFIDRHDPKSFFYLLEELEEFLLLELKSILDGNKSDAESIARAASIIKEVSRLSEKQDG